MARRRSCSYATSVESRVSCDAASGRTGVLAAGFWPLASGGEFELSLCELLFLFIILILIYRRGARLVQSFNLSLSLCRWIDVT